MALRGESLGPSAVRRLLFHLTQPTFPLFLPQVLDQRTIAALSQVIVRYLEVPDTSRTKASLHLI